MNLKKKQKQTHRYREQYNGYQWEERMREGQDRCSRFGGTNYHV